MNVRAHWDHVYKSKAPTQVSWYQEHSQLSLQFIQRTGIRKTDHIIDVGGGASTLVDDLIIAGYERISVLDISATALQLARQRLGLPGTRISWIEADVTQVELPFQTYDVWHDRAVFHFLTRPADRQGYIKNARHAVRKGGYVIVATFASDGPTHCSGLEVVRYSAEDLSGEFGRGFELVDSKREIHRTPFGTEQQFIYCYCCKH